MKFDWWKNCKRINCNWVVWDACIINKHCILHCICQENWGLKHNPYEREKHIEKQRMWERAGKKDPNKLI